MDGWVLSVLPGIAVAIGLLIVNARKTKKKAVLVPTILQHLLSGERTLPELAEAMRMGGFLARGKVALALNELVEKGEVIVVPAPDGTPQLKKVDHIRYRVPQSGSR
jgi:hypothetical protein